MNKKSDHARDVIAEITAQNLRDIIDSVSPETVEANKESWQNQINGYEASTDKSLDEPEPQSEPVVDDSNDSSSSEEDSPSEEDSE